MFVKGKGSLETSTHLRARSSQSLAFLLRAFSVNSRTTAQSALLRTGVFLVSIFVLALSSALFVAVPKPAHAATSSTLNFQGRLLDASGNVVPDGTYNIQFNLYTQASGGSTQWTESYLNNATQGVTLKYGYFSVQLGSLTSFPSTINWDQEQWLGMTVRGTGSCAFGSCTPTDSEMTPRFKLTAVPYAFKSAVAANVASNDTNAASTNSNNVSISSGNAAGTTSNSGNVSIDAGTATGTAGTINLGASNASAITLGRSGVTTTNSGALTVTQLVTANGGLTVATGQNFTVNGDSFTDLTGSGLTVSSGALTVSTASGTGFIQNQFSSTQTGNFNIQSANAAQVPAVIQGAASQSADFFQVLDSASTKLLYIDSAGKTFFNGDIVSATTGTIRTLDRTIAGNSVAFTIRSGSTVSGNTGGFSFKSGDATGGNSGSLSFDSGTATGTTGTISLAPTNASALNLGRSGLTTTNVGNLTIQGGTTTLGTTTQAGSLVVSDGSSNTGTIVVQSTAGNYTFTIPTVTANDTFCLQTLANCAGTTLQAAYNFDTDGSDTRIDLTAADDSIIFSNPASSGTDSTFVLKVEQLNTGAKDALIVSNSGTGNIVTLQTAGTTRAAFDANANLLAANSATGTTATTSGTGTNTTTLTFSATTSFANNDIIFIDNAGQDYYTRIVSGGNAASVTVSPAVTFETGRTVTKYTAQNIGASSTDYTTLTNRFFQGYFLGGVVTGAGSTTLSDGNLTATTNLNIQSPASTFTGTGVSTANVLSVQGNSLTTGTILSVNATTNTLTSGNLAVISQVGDYTGAEIISGNSLSINRSLSTNNAGSPTVVRQATTTANGGTNVTSRTFSHTVTAQVNQVLIVTVATSGNTDIITSVTYGGVALNRVVSTNGLNSQAAVFYLVNPTVGTANVVVTTSISRLIYAEASNFYNVDTTNPISNFAIDNSTSTSPSINVTSTSSNDLVFDIFAYPASSAITPGAGQTTIFTQAPVSALNSKGTTKAGTAGTVTMSNTNGAAFNHAYIAFNIKSSSALGIAVNGAAVSFSSNCTIILGNCYDSSNVVSINQGLASSTGSALKVVNAGVGNGLEVVDGSTTSFTVGDGGASTFTATAASTVALTVNNGTSTGNAFNVQDNGSNIFTVADGGGVTATGTGVTSGNVMTIQGNGLTSGNALSVSSNSLLLLTGKLASINQTGSFTQAESISTNLADISRSFNTDNTAVTVLKGTTINDTSSSSRASVTTSYTVTRQTNQILVVVVENATATRQPTSITYGGVALTQLTLAQNGSSSSVWYLVNPAVGTANVVVTMSSSTITYVNISNFYNVDLSNPISNFATDVTSSTTPSLNVTSTSTGDLLVDSFVYASSNTVTPGAGQTQYYQDVPTSSLLSKGSTKPGAAGTVTMSNTNGSALAHAYIAFNIKMANSPGIVVDGNAVNISSNCTVTTGTCYDSSNVLKVTQNFTGATGSVLKVTNAGTGNIAEFVDGSTTVFNIADGGATTFKNSVNSANAFAVQNSAGTNILKIDTTTDSANLITNPSFETNTTGWSALGTGTIVRSTAQQRFGTASLKLDGVDGSDGISYAYVASVNTKYTVSFYVKLTSSTSTGSYPYLYAMYNDGTNDINCTESLGITQSVPPQQNLNGWTLYTCSFYTGASVGGGSTLRVYPQVGSGAYTIYFDGFHLSTGTAGTLYREGLITGDTTFGNTLRVVTMTNGDALTIAGSDGRVALNVNTNTVTNLFTDPSNLYGKQEWTALGGATVDYSSTGYVGLVTTTATGDGMKANVTLLPNTVYTISFMAGQLKPQQVYTVGRQEVSGTDIACSSGTYFGNPNNYGYKSKFTCTFTTGGTITNSNIYIKQNGSTPAYADGAFFSDFSLVAGVYTESSSTVHVGEELVIGGLSSGSIKTISEGYLGGPATSYGGLEVYGTGEVYAPIVKSQNLSVSDYALIQNATLQNANGESLLSTVNDNNEIINPSFEDTILALANQPYWFDKTGSGVTIANQNTNVKFGGNGLEITTTGTNSGVSYKSGAALAASTTYTFSFYASKSTGSLTTLAAGRSDTGSSDSSCTLNSTTVTTTMARYYCTFTTSATTSAGGFLYITQGATAGAMTLYLDGVKLERSASVTPFEYASFNIQAPTTFAALDGNSSQLKVINGAAATIFNIDTVTGTTTINNGTGTGNILSVQDNGTAVLGIVDGGAATFTNTSNSTAAFVIQNATGADVLFAADTTNNRLKVGNSTGTGSATTLLVLDSAASGTPTGVAGAMYYDSTGGKFKCYTSSWVDCDTTGSGGSQTYTKVINAEYEASVIKADGSNNSGTLTSDYDGTARRNYYDWTTTQTSLQDYDVVVQTQLPSNYANSFGTFKIWAWGNSTSTANNDIQVTVVDNSGTSCASAVSVLPGTATTWTQQSVTLSGCSYAANDIITITVKVLSKSSNNVRIGGISYQWSN